MRVSSVVGALALAVLALAGAVAALLPCSEKIAPYIDFADVHDDFRSLDVAGGPQRVKLLALAKSQSPIATIRMSFWNNENPAEPVFAVFSDWIATDVEDAYEVWGLVSTVDPNGVYTLNSIVLTDIYGLSATITDFSNIASREIAFTVVGARAPIKSTLKQLAFSPTDMPVDVTVSSKPLKLRFSVGLNAGVSFRSLLLEFKCNHPTLVASLLYTTTNATFVSATTTVATWNGEISTIIAAGTRDCYGQYGYILSRVEVSDSSYLSTRTPTSIAPSSVSGTDTITVKSKPDTIAPTLTSFRVLPAPVSKLNATFVDLQLMIAIVANDNVNGSGIGSITFTGAFATGVSQTVVLTPVNLVTDGSYPANTYLGVVRGPQGFPASTWSFTSPIVVADKAQNKIAVATGSYAPVSVSCGPPSTIKIKVPDPRNANDPALNGVVALLLIVVALALALCFYALRRQQAKYSLEADTIPADPNAKPDPPLVDESAAGSAYVEPVRAPVDQLAASARDAVAEMAAARAQLEAERVRQEAATREAIAQRQAAEEAVAAAQAAQAASEAAHAAHSAAVAAAAATTPAAAAAVELTSIATATPAPSAAVVVDASPAPITASPAPSVVVDAADTNKPATDTLDIHVSSPSSPTTSAAAAASQPDLL